jgi:hypothetical protein
MHFPPRLKSHLISSFILFIFHFQPIKAKDPSKSTNSNGVFDRLILDLFLRNNFADFQVKVLVERPLVVALTDGLVGMGLQVAHVHSSQAGIGIVDLLDVFDNHVFSFLRKSDVRLFSATFVGEVLRFHLLKADVDARVGNLECLHECLLADFHALEIVLPCHFSTTGLFVFRVTAFFWCLIDARVEEGAAALVASDVPKHVEDLSASLQGKFHGICTLFGACAHEGLVELSRLNLLTFGVDVALVGVGSLLSDLTCLVRDRAFAAFWLSGI